MASERVPIARLVAAPAALSLAVTLLRLAGELGHWSERWFSTATQGVVPSGVSWLFGITWLPVPFGVYFAWRLARSGERPASCGRALALGLLGPVLFVGLALLRSFVPLSFPRSLLYTWLCMVIPAALQRLAWPRLFTALAVYGLAARIPVAVIMFVAMWRGWGTHYDYVGTSLQFSMPFVPRFLWLAFFPQLVFWVGFTIVVGAFAGNLTGALLARSARRAAPVPTAA